MNHQFEASQKVHQKSCRCPQAWANVAFDWDDRLSAPNGEYIPAAVMPECIRPREWPPKVAA